jgi:abhydrolase domain-containing protein 17
VLFPLTVPLGPPSEEDCYADIEAAYEYLRRSLHVPAQNIVLYGRSLGSGPSCYLATKTALESHSPKQKLHGDGTDGPVGGLILHAPFLSVYRVVIDPGCTLPGDKFVNIDVLPMVRSPTILIHGTSDQIVPFHHSERLFEAIPKEHQARPLYIEGMSHNNVHAQVRPMFVDRLTDYLRDHVWPYVVVRRRPIVASSIVRKRIFKVVENARGDDEVPDCEEVSDYDDDASAEGNRMSIGQQQ